MLETRREAASVAALQMEQLVTDTIRAIPGGEIAFGSYMVIDGKGYEYIAGRFQEVIDTAKMATEIAKNNPGMTLTVVAGVVVFAADGKLISRANAPKDAGHYTDFADEAADIMENAARSRGLTPNANVVIMALSRKDALKRLEGLSPQVRAHLDKLAKSPTSRDAPHWRGEIKTWLEQMENVVDSTGKNTSTEWLNLIKKWRQQAGIE